MPGTAALGGSQADATQRERIAVLEITDLGHSYGRGGGTHLAVDGISLKAEKGEIVSIVGASGCGKSTVLRCIAGLQRPTRGTIRVNGAVVDAVVPEGLAVSKSKA